MAAVVWQPIRGDRVEVGGGVGKSWTGLYRAGDFD